MSTKATPTRPRWHTADAAVVTTLDDLELAAALTEVALHPLRVDRTVRRALLLEASARMRWGRRSEARSTQPEPVQTRADEVAQASRARRTLQTGRPPMKRG